MGFVTGPVKLVIPLFPQQDFFSYMQKHYPGSNSFMSVCNALLIFQSVTIVAFICLIQFWTCWPFQTRSGWPPLSTDVTGKMHRIQAVYMNDLFFYMQ